MGDRCVVFLFVEEDELLFDVRVGVNCDAADECVFEAVFDRWDGVAFDGPFKSVVSERLYNDVFTDGVVAGPRAATFEYFVSIAWATSEVTLFNGMAE